MAIGFIGFGEASYHIAKGLSEEGIKHIRTYDVNIEDNVLGSKIKERANEIEVAVDDSLEDLVSNSQIVFCATSANSALNIGKEASKHITDRKVYVDLNATSPTLQQQISEYFDTGLFVDGAVLDSIPAFKHRVPIAISGSGSDRLLQLNKDLKMSFEKIDDMAGSASALKMSRSIFMKGFTALLIETLSISDKYDANKLVLDSIDKTLKRDNLNNLAESLINRTIIHAKRRIGEMEQVIETLKESDLDFTMSEAIRNKLDYISSMELEKEFDYEIPQSYQEVLEKLSAK